MTVFFSSLLRSSCPLFSWKFWVSQSARPGQNGDSCPPCPGDGSRAAVVSEHLPPRSCGRRWAPRGPRALPTAGAPPSARSGGNRSSISAGPLAAVTQHVLEVLPQLLVVYGAKEVPAGVGCLPWPPFHLFSPVLLSSDRIQQRLPAKDRKITSHPLHTQFSGQCIVFKGRVAVNLDSFDPAAGNLGLFWKKFIPICSPEWEFPSIGCVYRRMGRGEKPSLLLCTLISVYTEWGLALRGQRHMKKWTTSLEVVQQKPECTEVQPGETDHEYHLKQGKGPENEDFQDNEGWWQSVKDRRHL